MTVCSVSPFAPRSLLPYLMGSTLPDLLAVLEEPVGSPVRSRMSEHDLAVVRDRINRICRAEGGLWTVSAAGVPVAVCQARTGIEAVERTISSLIDQRLATGLDVSRLIDRTSFAVKPYPTWETLKAA